MAPMGVRSPGLNGSPRTYAYGRGGNFFQGQLACDNESRTRTDSSSIDADGFVSTGVVRQSGNAAVSPHLHATPTLKRFATRSSTSRPSGHCSALAPG